jgi:hypothetical protein
MDLDELRRALAPLRKPFTHKQWGEVLAAVPASARWRAGLWAEQGAQLQLRADLERVRRVLPLGARP